MTSDFLEDEDQEHVIELCRLHGWRTASCWKDGAGEYHFQAWQGENSIEVVISKLVQHQVGFLSILLTGCAHGAAELLRSRSRPPFWRRLLRRPRPIALMVRLQVAIAMQEVVGNRMMGEKLIYPWPCPCFQGEIRSGLPWQNTGRKPEEGPEVDRRDELAG